MLSRNKTSFESRNILPNIRFFKVLVLTFSTLLITSCGSLNPLKSPLNPFAKKEVVAQGTPANATEYVCEGNKHFYVRMLNNNADAWLIYPDHEVNLTQSSTEKSVYTSGAIRLNLAGEATTLNDGEKIAYTACKPIIKPTK